MPCLFCEIVGGRERSWPIWSDDGHLAFLSPFPNTEGFTVVVPKKHLSSDLFGLDGADYLALMAATREVGRVLARGLSVGRVAMIGEGLGIDHAHTKLAPLHGVAPGAPWKPIRSTRRDFYVRYEGFVASHDGPPASVEALDRIAKMVRSAGGP